MQTTQTQIRSCTQIPWETTQKTPQLSWNCWKRSDIKRKYAENNWSALRITAIQIHFTKRWYQMQWNYLITSYEVICFVSQSCRYMGNAQIWKCLLAIHINKHSIKTTLSRCSEIKIGPKTGHESPFFLILHFKCIKSSGIMRHTSYSPNLRMYLYRNMASNMYKLMNLFSDIILCRTTYNLLNSPLQTDSYCSDV